MKRKQAALIFLGVCVILAILLLKQLITPIAGSILFAIGLALFGILSRGFSK